MFVATLTEPNGTTFILSRSGWSESRNDWEILTFATKRDAYRAYLRAFKRATDVYRAVPADKVWTL